MIALFLTLPLYPLFHWSQSPNLDGATMAKIMGLQTSCTLLFGLVLTACTTAKRHEIFTASATYVCFPRQT